MNEKIINNSSIIAARQNILKVVNNELNNGLPVAVISMILHNCVYDLDDMLAMVISKENDMKKDNGTSTEGGAHD